MRPNRLRAIWREGGFALNAWLASPSAYTAEAMAHLGWDSLTIDLQHGPIDLADAFAMLAAISTTATVPLVRVPWNEPSIVMRVLDAGAYGVVCPMLDTPEDARRFVAACRYPPAGQRSFGPNRAGLYGGPDYAACANDQILALGQIETAAALTALDGILSVEGFDGIYVGPADLSAALGYPPRSDVEEPAVLAAIGEIAEACRAHGRIAGIHTGSPGYAQRMLKLGYRFVTVGSDVGMLTAKAKENVAAMRQPPPA